MNLISPIKKLGQFAFDLVFPIACLICGKEEVFLCSSCAINLPSVKNQKCVICTNPSPFGKTHEKCGTKNNLDGIISALAYSDKNVKEIIRVFKYKFVSGLGDPISKRLIGGIENSGLREFFADFIIVPVPLHQRRLNWRTFNQAQILAEKLSEGLQIPLKSYLVARIKNTRPQVGLTQAERKQNIASAFDLLGETNGKYLLIDDVVTSGATLNEIAKVLKSKGATEVWAATVAQG